MTKKTTNSLVCVINFAFFFPARTAQLRRREEKGSKRGMSSTGAG
jgi:hypothetical protein